MSRHSIKDRRWREVTVPAILERDGHACAACGATEDLTVDHIKPVDLFTDEDHDADLGHDPNNLVTLCRSCNSRKGNRERVRLTWYSPRWFPNGVSRAGTVF